MNYTHIIQIQVSVIGLCIISNKRLFICRFTYNEIFRKNWELE